jgi:hypothetical protein
MLCYQTGVVRRRRSSAWLRTADDKPPCQRTRSANLPLRRPPRNALPRDTSYPFEQGDVSTSVATRVHDDLTMCVLSANLDSSPQGVAWDRVVVRPWRHRIIEVCQQRAIESRLLQMRFLSCSRANVNRDRRARWAALTSRSRLCKRCAARTARWPNARTRLAVAAAMSGRG